MKERMLSFSATFVVLLTLCLWGCGDGNGSTSSASPVPRVIAQGAFSIGTTATAIAISDPCDLTEFIPFTTNRAGTLEASVDWTFETSNLDVGIFDAACTCRVIVDAVLAGNEDELDQICRTFGQSVNVTEKPERVTVPNLSAGNYVMIVLNNTDQVESCSYQIILTPST